MTSSESGQAPTQASKESRKAAVWQWFTSLATWQKVSLGVACLFLVLGLVTMMVEGPSPSPGTQGNPPAQGQGGQPSNWVPGPGQPKLPGPNQPSQGPGAGPWSAGFFRLGFSFFAGFSIGMALRSFMKLALIGSGIALLFLLLLSYGDLISVNWSAIDALFENLGKRISEESGRFQSFITGSLPSTGLAALGLTTSLRRGHR